MRLQSFQVRNFRSVADSGMIEVAPRTVLLGRNESGKTNLLLALNSLNPPGGPKSLSYVKDHPRQSEGFDENQEVVSTLWHLSEAERSELAAIFPRAAGVAEISVSRAYKPARQVGFHGLPPLAVNQETVEKQTRGLDRAIKNQLKELADNSVVEKASRALTILAHELTSGMQEPAEWAARILKVIPAFRQALLPLKLSLPENAAAQLDSLSQHAGELAADKDQQQKAVAWVLERLPVFVYLDEYPQLRGHQNLKAFMLRLEKNQLEEADQHFVRLCKAAELDPVALSKMLATDHQQRQVLANRAGAVVTKKLRELWRDRPLKVRFHLDAEHFDTLVSDPSETYDVEVNLDERSHGFKWFFSFYITFASAGGLAKNAILLLDEPGMYLHPQAQRDLLAHFSADFHLPLIYTTHSPFMIEHPATVRTVTLAPAQGTRVSNQAQGDAATLLPLRAALAYELGEALWAAGPALVVEELCDFWYLRAALDFLRLPALDGVEIIPAGRLARFSALPGSCAVFLRNTGGAPPPSTGSGNGAPPANSPLPELVEGNGECAVHLQDLFPGAQVLEDLLEPAVYQSLAQQAGVSAPSTGSGSEGRVALARIFLRRMGEQPEAVLTPPAAGRFRALLETVAARLRKKEG